MKPPEGGFFLVCSSSQLPRVAQESSASALINAAAHRGNRSVAHAVRTTRAEIWQNNRGHPLVAPAAGAARLHSRRCFATRSPSPRSLAPAPVPVRRAAAASRDPARDGARALRCKHFRSPGDPLLPPLAHHRIPGHFSANHCGTQVLPVYCTEGLTMKNELSVERTLTYSDAARLRPHSARIVEVVYPPEASGDLQP
jgi:hypothetical protein